MIRTVNTQEEYVVSTKCGLPSDDGGICGYYRKASEDEREAKEKYKEHLENHSLENLQEYALEKAMLLTTKRLIEEERTHH